MKTKIQKRAVAVATLLLTVSIPAFADNTVANLPDVLMANLGLIADIMQTLAILIGLGLFLHGMFLLKRYGEMRTMMSAQMTIAGPLMYIVSGTAMLFSPLLMGTALVSFWGPTGITDVPYNGDTSNSWSQYVEPVLMLVRLVGVYAFMRGFVMAARIGGGHAQPGTVGRVLIHIFAGILCVHIMGTITLIESILGIDLQI